MTTFPPAQDAAERRMDRAPIRFSLDLSPLEYRMLCDAQELRRVLGDRVSKRAILLAALAEYTRVERGASLRGGAPSKLTPEVRRTILASLALGATRKAAVSAAGVSERSFYRWRRINWQFWHEMKRAQAKIRARQLRRLHRQSAEVVRHG